MKPLPAIRCFAACLAVLAPSLARGQGTRADYARADSISHRTADRVTDASVDPHWADDGNSFWYATDHGRSVWVVDAVAGTRLAATDAERATFHTDRLQNLGAPRPSGEAGEPTSITFVNRTAAEARFFWLDNAGRPVPYGEVPPGGRASRHTYAGHVWLVRDPAGATLGVFAAAAGDAQAIVGPDDGAATRPASGPASAPTTHASTQATTRAAAGALRWWARSARDRLTGRSDPARSPDGRWLAAVRDGDVYLAERATGRQVRLTSDAGGGVGYEPAGFAWSPDSRHLVALRTVDGDHRVVNIVQAAPPGDPTQPRLLSFEYAKPGDRIPITKPHLFDVEAGRETPVDDALFPTPWQGDDARVRWDADSGRFTFYYNQRGHQVARVIAVDAATGHTSSVVDERSPTFICYSSKSFLEFVNDDELIWMSERDGWNHLYLYDAKAGRVKNAITQGPWVVRSVDRVDRERRQVWFQAGGVDPQQDPYHVHSCRVNFDGTGLVDLTPGDGTHAVRFSPDGRYYVDTYSRVDLPPVSELRRASDGGLVCTLARADASRLLETGWRYPERFVAKGRDGATDIYGVIVRPSNFDPAKRYPVIESIYAGPTGAFVPKSFGVQAGLTAMAELGFVVVQIDGMGTNFRSKAFHDVCWHNLGDAGFPDRIAWIRAAAAAHPEMDLSRGVGIYGTSAGGQSALRALEAHGDFYRVAVADCGCHDNRVDKIWWNEQWMGWPIGPWYAEQSNVTNAKDLRGDLLLIVGEVDRNVDPASTMQVVDALIRADKDFDLLVIPNADHGQDGAYGERRRRDFFVRHLLGVEPRTR